MGLNFLQQLLTVAGLAFASGLLLGVAVLRGEIGVAPGERRSVKRPRRRPITASEVVKAVTTAVSGLDPALKWVLLSLAIMLLTSAAITRLME